MPDEDVNIKFTADDSDFQAAVNRIKANMQSVTDDLIAQGKHLTSAMSKEGFTSQMLFPGMDPQTKLEVASYAASIQKAKEEQLALQKSRQDSLATDKELSSVNAIIEKEFEAQGGAWAASVKQGEKIIKEVMRAPFEERKQLTKEEAQFVETAWAEREIKIKEGEEQRYAEAKQRGKQALLDIQAEQRMGEEGGAGRPTGFMGRVIQDLQWGAESFGRYMVVWKTLDVALQEVDKSFQTLGEDVQVFSQIQHRSGQSISETIAEYGKLQTISEETGATVGETSKRVNALFAAGYTRPEALDMAKTIQKDLYGVDFATPILEALSAADVPIVGRLAQFGLEIKRALAPEDVLTPLAEKLKTLSATPQDILKAAQTSPKFAAMAEPARQEIDRQAWEPMVQHRFELQQVNEQRLFEDKTHFQQRSMEVEEMVSKHQMDLRQRGESQALEDTHFRAQDEMEMANRTLNRKMELQNRATHEAMEDRDREASEAEQDEQRLMDMRDTAINREMEDRHRANQEHMDDALHALTLEEDRISVAQETRSIAKEERDWNKDTKGMKWEDKEEKYQRLQERKERLEIHQEQRRLHEQQRNQERKERHEEIGEHRRQQVERIDFENKQIQQRRGRIHEQLAENRREEHESFNRRNQQQDKSHDMMVNFHHENTKMSRDHTNERDQHEWQHSVKRSNLNETIYQHQRDQQRKEQNFRLKQEDDALEYRYKSNLQAKEKLQKASPDHRPGGAAPGEAPLPAGAGLGFGAAYQKAQEEAETPATEATLNDVYELLQQVLSSG